MKMKLFTRKKRKKKIREAMEKGKPLSGSRIVGDQPPWMVLTKVTRRGGFRHLAILSYFIASYGSI